MPQGMVSLLGRNLIGIVASGYAIALACGSLMRPVKIANAPTYTDKLLHAGAYFGLTLLWVITIWLFQKGKRPNIGKPEFKKVLLWVAFAAIVYGTIIEVLQGSMTDYRTPDGWDILANSIGVLLALVLLHQFINKLVLLKTKF